MAEQHTQWQDASQPPFGSARMGGAGIAADVHRSYSDALNRTTEYPRETRLPGSPMIQITSELAVDESELTFGFTRSSGPGGQNVNRVETAVQLRFNVLESPSLPDSVKARLVRLAGNRMAENGDLVITAQEYRSQRRNREAALTRLCELIRRAGVRPKRRRPTRPTKAARERRMESKKKKGRTKRLRRPPSREDH